MGPPLAIVNSYTGISFVETDLIDPDARHPASADLIGAGFFLCLGDRKGFLAHRETDGSLHVYTALAVPVDWLDGIDFTDAQAAKNAVLAQFEGWADTLRALIADADGPVVPRRIYALPAGHRWDRVPGVTLLGDAAHLMSPFAGEGANLAMLDGAELGTAITAHGGDTEAALVQRLEASSGTRFVTAFGGVVEVLRRLGVQRIAYATPYDEALTERGRAHLTTHGFDVVGMARLEGVRNIYEETPARAYAIGKQADRPEAEAVFLSGTGMPTLSILQALEDDLGKPVISAASAMMWAALRAAGVSAQRPGYGRLFARTR